MFRQRPLLTATVLTTLLLCSLYATQCDVRMFVPIASNGARTLGRWVVVRHCVSNRVQKPSIAHFLSDSSARLLAKRCTYARLGYSHKQ